MAVEVTQNLTQVTISSVGVAGVNGTSGTSGTFGNVLSSSFYISGSIIPSVGDGEATSSFSLGSSTNAWKDLWISEGTIYFIGGNLQTQSISLNENNEIVLSSFNLNTASLITTASYNEFTSSFGDFTSSYFLISESIASRLDAATNEQDLSTYLSQSVFNEFTSSYEYYSSSISDRVVALEDFSSSFSVIESGTSGTSGLTITGSAGTSGTSGLTITGSAGSDGTSGTAGTSGTSGLTITGSAGTSGTSGLSLSGSAGSDGTSGTAGTSGTSALVDTLLFATTGSNTFVGNQIVSGALNIATNGGDEGGELQLGLAQTNTTLTGSIVFDVYTDKLRLFEGGGNNRGAFLNVASQSNNVSSEIVTSTTVSKIETITSASYAALNPPVSGTLYIII